MDQRSEVSISTTDCTMREEHEDEQRWAAGHGDCVMTDMDCFSMELNSQLGRHLLTKRPLNQGQLILTEKPLVHGANRDSPLVCFGCYGQLNEEDPACCELCGLPLCSDTCDQESHHKPECDLFIMAGGVSQARHISFTLLDDISLLHDVVLVLRCLRLMTTDPPGWQALTQMESHTRSVPEVEQRSHRVVDFILQEIDRGDWSRQLLLHVCGLLDVNCFEMPNLSWGSDALVQALYAQSCLLEHNCVPNVHRSFEADLSIRIRAAVNIECGSHLCITYTDSLWPTLQRRSHLFSSKHFSCSCSRCASPNELGTYLGAIKCLKCPAGSYLPLNPLSEDAEWECEQCLATVPASYSLKVNNEVEQAIKLMEQVGLDPDMCEQFLLIHSRVLHQNHAHMLDIKHSLLHLLGHHEGCLMADLSEQQLQSKEDVGRTLLAIADRVLPGISRLRGTTLYELFHTYQQRALNWYRSGERSTKDVMSAFKTAEKCLLESIDTLQFEPAHSAEGKLAIRARQEVDLMRQFVQTLPTA